MSAESEGDVAAELGTNCNLGKTMASVCPAWRCPHQENSCLNACVLLRSENIEETADSLLCLALLRDEQRLRLGEFVDGS